MKLLDHLGNNAGANGAAAFTDSEAEALLDGDGGDQLDLHVDVIAGHHHFHAFGQLDIAGHVGGAEIELGTIAVEEGGVTAAFFLGQDVHLADEVGVRMNGAGLGQNLTTLDLVTLHAAQQSAHVVASLGHVQQSCGTFPDR